MTKKLPEWFETQLSNRYGNKLYNELYDRGADFEYINCLDCFLHLGDRWNLKQDQMHKQSKAYKIKKMRGVERNFERLAVSSPNHSLVKLYSDMYRQRQTHVDFPEWFGRVFGKLFRVQAPIMEKRIKEKFDKLIRSNVLGLILSEYSPSPDEGGKRRNSEEDIRPL